MGEQRFKVGDWVRRVEPSDWPEQYGVVDGIYKVLKVGRYGIAVTVGEGEADANSFEPWQPRVGERVKVVRAELSHKADRIGLEFNVTHEAYKVCNGVQTWGGDNAGGYVWRADELEPILTTTPEQPATIKIKAGKFYKTRDGRKVGPIVEDKWHDRQYGWTVAHEFNAEYGKAWRGDGTFHPDVGTQHGADLIAAWIDEPAAKASNDNTTPKFKAGDRVRVVKGGFVSGGSGHGAKVGNEFVLKEMDPSKAFWRTNGPDFYEHEIELVVVAAIVALIENGQPKPSSTPHVHTSTGAAEKEAKRLAAKYKGQQFGVFTLTTTHEEAAPVYDHKWQNMAYLGLKIDAIKELRAVAGLTLKGAKDAVEAWIEYENAA